jgi:chromosome partitioning protein
MRIEPFPLPRIGVFMNKAKPYGGLPTKESQFYMREVKNVCNKAAEAQQIHAKFFDAWIPERVGIKRAITGGGVPYELVKAFKDLWTEIIGYLQ